MAEPARACGRRQHFRNLTDGTREVLIDARKSDPRRDRAPARLICPTALCAEGSHHDRKEIAYDIDARERMLRGVQKLAKAVKVTLGPSGAS